MTLPVHHVTPELIASAGVGEPVLLDGPEGRHAVTVRRTRVGEAIELVDGSGTRCRITVTELVGGSALVGTVDQVIHEPSPSPRVVVVQALAKGDRGETAVETLTEVGVDEVVPWQAARCVVRWSEGSGGLEKWRRVAIEAGKQSRRARFPVVADVASTDEVVRRVRGAAVALLLDEAAEVALPAVALPAEGEVLLIVGPEGGVTPEEAGELIAAGARPARMGPTVLRTSTAGTAAASVVLSATGRWG